MFMKDSLTQGVNNHPPGVPQLAYFLSSNDNFAVYRRFGWLSARLLVTLEIELTELEQKLLNLDAEDVKDSTLINRLWGRDNFEGWNDAQKIIVEAIRTKIGQYCRLQLVLVWRNADLIQLNYFCKNPRFEH